MPFILSVFIYKLRALRNEQDFRILQRQTHRSQRRKSKINTEHSHSFGRLAVLYPENACLHAGNQNKLFGVEHHDSQRGLHWPLLHSAPQ